MTASCWTRFWWELRPSYHFYSLKEAEGEFFGSTTSATTTTAGQHRYIDVARSFAPHRWAILFRFFFLAWSLQVLYTDVSHYPPHNLYIYMGYLTHWGHLLSNLYLLCSFLCSIIPSAVQQPTAENERPGRLVRTTWGLYSLVAPLEIAITLLYWSGAPFISGHGCYVSVMEHGGIATLVLIDGLLVGLVPVRAKHVVLLVTVSVLYLAWSVIDAVLEIGNGEWGPAYEDDALYPVLNWNDDQRGATIVSAFVICILSPCLFYGCWLLSLAAPCCVSRAAIVLTDDEDVVKHSSCCCCLGTFVGSRRPLYKYPLAENASSTASEYKVMEDGKEFV